jgi:hypothetical protein
MFAKRLSKIFLSVALAATMFSCSNRIGPNADKSELKGDVTETTIFPGGPKQSDIRLDASNLKEGEAYSTSGKLTINGNIPKNVMLSVNDGKLVVNGNIGAGSNIDVNEPIVSHTENDPGYDYGYNSFSGKFEWHYDFSKTKTVVDGLKYNDPDPAVQVNGSCGENVKINSNGKIVVKDHQVQNKNQLNVAPALK